MKANLPGKISKVLSWFYEIYYGFGEAYWDRETNQVINKLTREKEKIRCQEKSGNQSR